jgi:uncharacterized protein with PQ loop repeat
MKETLGTIAVILTFLAYIPYYRDILMGKTRPHVYSWSLWGLLTVLLVGLQIKGGAGAAVWVTAAAGLLCFGVVLLSLKNGNKDITKSDTVVALLSLVAIFFWLVVERPIISITLVILADILAFIPTVRKSYNQPYSETLSLYTTNALRFILALFAVENYNYLSTSWIVAWVLGNAGLSIMLMVRRKQLGYRA